MTTKVKISVGLVLVAVLVSTFALAGLAGTEGTATRSGALHVTKECSEYNGQAGSFCTITGSNLPAIGAGAKVFYMEPVGATSLDTDVVLYVGPGTLAVGHVVLDVATGQGHITFKTGTGLLAGFRARAVVSVDSTGVWHWDGTYSFQRSGPRD